jgi:hypothetical protein
LCLIFLWLLTHVEDEQFAVDPVEAVDPPVPPGRCAALVGPMANLTGAVPSSARARAASGSTAPAGVDAAANARLDGIIIAAHIRKTARVMPASVITNFADI